MSRKINLFQEELAVLWNFINPFAKHETLAVYRKTLLHTNEKKNIMFKCILIVVVLREFTWIYLCIVPVSEWTQLLLIDLAQLHSLPKGFNLLSTIFFTQTIFLLNELYVVCYKNKLVEMSYQTVYLKNTNYFLYDTVNKHQLSDCFANLYRFLSITSFSSNVFTC